MKLSFVIPVYRTPPQLLRDCLNSVLAYSGPMELVCVLDSPGEPCEAVLDEFAAKEPRVRLLKNDRNRGVSYSRNRGLDAATGACVTFVDADDRIIASVYEQGMERIGREGADCCRLRVCGDRDPGFGPDACVTGTLFDAGAAGLPIGLLAMSACLTLFRTEVLRTLGLRFPEDYHCCEDMIFMERFMVAGRRIAFLNACGYEIVGHPDSTCHRRATDADTFVQTLRANLGMLRDVIDKGVPDVVSKWYLKTFVMFLLSGRGAVRSHVTGADRIGYVRLLRDTAGLVTGICARFVTLPTRALFALVRRAPRLWFLPGMPLMFALRILNHYGLVVRRS